MAKKQKQHARPVGNTGEGLQASLADTLAGLQDAIDTRRQPVLEVQEKVQRVRELLQSALPAYSLAELGPFLREIRETMDLCDEKLKQEARPLQT